MPHGGKMKRAVAREGKGVAYSRTNRAGRLACIFLLLSIVGGGHPAGAQSRTVRYYGYFDTVYGFNRFASDTLSWDAFHLDLIGSWLLDEHFRLVAETAFEHGPQHTEELTGDIEIRGFIEIMLNEALRINVGKFLLPFGDQNLYHDATPAYYSVEPPRSVYWKRRIGFDAAGNAVEDRYFEKYGVGIWAAGSFFPGDEWEIDYDLYTTNGRGSGNIFKEDDNRSPGLGAKLLLYTPHGFKIGGSWYRDVHGMVVGVTQPSEGERTAPAPDGSEQGGSFTSNNIAGQIGWDHGPFHFRGEVLGSFGVFSAQDSPDTSFDALGWYVEGVYTLFERISPYFRFEEFHADFEDQRERIVRGGIHYAFPNSSVFLKVEHAQYLIREPPIPSPIEPGNDVPDFETMAQIAVAF
ncbi:MAG: hypothetical protein D6812_08760 [Deltaproteobacteria bacterium]|nr:MAG: hypothetical protein D6812_08760 [Deltaproteobacteria bacterium]